MPRTGWAALGAVVAALVAVQVQDLRLLLLGTATSALILVLSRIVQSRQGVIVAASSAGALLVLLRAVAGGALAPPEAPMALDAASSAKHTGIVLSVATPDGGQQRAVVKLRPPEPAVSAYVWLPRYPQIVPQDVITFDGRLELPPADGDFADYLARSGIDYTDKARTLSLLGSDGSPLAALEDLRRGANELIDRVLPEPQAGLATAMAIGLRDVVARDVNDDFRTSGLSHVVAISGWHIAMLGAVVAALLGGLPRRPRSLLVILAIAAYAIIAGAAPSILRAALMAAAVIVARESGRRGQAKAALALTCLALLVLDPVTVTDVGFELSAVATAGLLAWATPLHDWLARHLPQRTPGWLVEALAVSLAAQAATLPLVLVQFGRLSLVAPLANLLIAPLVAPAMLVTAICLAAGAVIALGIPALVLAPISLIGALLIGAMIWIAHVCAALPFAAVDLPAPLNYAGAAASALAIVLVVRRARTKRKLGAGASAADATPHGNRLRLRRTHVVALSAALVLTVLLAVVALARPDGRLHVTLLDIGQGDSILLEGPQGGRMLIDTGPDPDLELQRLDERIPAWDRRIDLVVLTHPHEDHVGGLWLLLERYRVSTVVESGMVGRGPGDGAYRHVLAEQGRMTTSVAAGDHLTLDGIQLNIDWPPPGSVPPKASDDGKQVNDESVVIDLRYGNRTMLFTGDMEEEIDPQLLAGGLAARTGSPIDVLKVAHHGSGTATTNALLDALQPRVAAISVGADNSYGHPAPSTLERLATHGARVYRTDLDGSIEITTDGTDLTVTTDHERAPNKHPSPAASLAVPPTYNRRHGRALARRRRCPGSQPEPEREAAAPLDGRGGGRCIPGRCHGPPRRGTRRGGRRCRGAAPRPGQDAA